MGFTYDLFILCAQADQPWVDSYLLLRLKQAQLRVATSEQFILGMPRLQDIQRLVQVSRRTVMILTPDWWKSELNEYATLVARDLDAAGRRRKVLPLLLKPCELPDTVTALHLSVANFTDSRRWNRETQRLIRDTQDLIPLVPPIGPKGFGTLQEWRRWFWRYRRSVWVALASLDSIWLIVAVVWEWPPISITIGLARGDIPAPDPYRLVRAGDVLLVSTTTDTAFCQPSDPGLWRSKDGGTAWQPVDAPLTFTLPTQPCVRAMINAFGLDPDRPQRIYAATSHVGLLRSDTNGQTWARVGHTSTTQPLDTDELSHVVVVPDQIDNLYVAGASQGVFRSHDGGQNWQRLDGATTCQAGNGVSLPPTFVVGAMLATTQTIFVGSDKPSGQLYPRTEDGLYESDDGGNCWQRLDNALNRYGYIALSDVPGHPDDLLMLTFDYAVTDGAPERTLRNSR
ncbi:MAG: TIR domain-containing protein [Anaerolineae bacterium]|nr:TIR domain-containing protein [Anaerolineae bacterium]